MSNNEYGPSTAFVRMLLGEKAPVLYSIEEVSVGSAGHLRRYKVLDAEGKYVPGGLFRTAREAQDFITTLTPNR